jgi:hypothetical protein
LLKRCIIVGKICHNKISETRIGRFLSGWH